MQKQTDFSFEQALSIDISAILIYYYKLHLGLYC